MTSLPLHNGSTRPRPVPAGSDQSQPDPTSLSRVRPTDCGLVRQRPREDVGGDDDETAGRPGDLAGLCGFTDPPGALVSQRSHQGFTETGGPTLQWARPVRG